MYMLAHLRKCLNFSASEFDGLALHFHKYMTSVL